MSLSFLTYLRCLSIGLVVPILLAVVRIIFRQKFVSAFLTVPETNRERFFHARERFINSERRIFRLLRLVFWPTLFMTVFFPFFMYVYAPTYFPASAIYMVLFAIAFLLEYFFRKWLLDRLEAGLTTT